VIETKVSDLLDSEMTNDGITNSPAHPATQLSAATSAAAAGSER